jgi:hypothetical protein
LELAGVQAPLSARTLGHDAPEPGEQVELTVAGEVMAYPAAATVDEPTTPEPEALPSERAGQR